MSLAYLFREILAKRRIQKFNENHDALGRFTYGQGGVHVSDPKRTMRTPAGVQVVQNPTEEEYTAMREAILEDTPWLRGTGEPLLRMTYDEEGNEYYWDASKAIHSSVEPYINEHYSTRTSQQYKWFEQPDKDDYPIDYSYLRKYNHNHDPATGKFTTGSSHGKSFEEAAYDSEGNFDPLSALMWAADHPTEAGGSGSTETKTKRTNPKSQLSEAAMAKCKEVESQSVKRSDEQLTIIGNDGNIVFQTTGNNDSVVLTPGMAHKAEARTITHNHPQEFGGTFSLDDLSAFASGMTPPKAIRAVTNEGVYHLERGGAEHKQVFAFNEAATSACQTAMMEIAQGNKLVDQDVRNGVMTKEAGEKKKAEMRRGALEGLSRDYERIADAHGLIYFFEPTASSLKKYNQNHDPHTGRFTTGNGSGSSDAAYMDAAKRGDVATCRKMLEQKAQRLASDGAYAKETATYKLREGAEPQKTIKVYKTFYVDEDGNPSALFVEGTSPLPVGVWMDAKDAFHFTSPTNGKEYTPSRVNPNAEPGKGATGTTVPVPNEAVRQELVDRGFLPEDSTAKSVTALAYRPGWHAGDLPYFPQGGAQDPVYAAEEKAYAQLARDLKAEHGVSDGKAKKMREELYGTFEQWRPQESRENHPYKNLHEARQVVFECELTADHDYTRSEPIKSGDNKGKTRFQDMQEMPKDGSYKFATNPMANAQDLGAWYIGGSLRIVRPLSQQECDSALKASGRAPQAWTTGEMSLEKLGVNKANSLEPIIYDSHGDIVPLSDRFKTPVRKSATPTGCGVLVVNDRGEVLCGRRIERASRGQICGPGGHIEDGETAEQAAIREAREEFNIECRNLKRLGTQNGGRHGVSAVFLCTDYSGDPKTDEEEMTDCRWEDPEDLQDNLFPPFASSLELLEIKKYNMFHGKDGKFTYSPFKHDNHMTEHFDAPNSRPKQSERVESKETRRLEGQSLGRVGGQSNRRGHLDLFDGHHVQDESGRTLSREELVARDLGRPVEETRSQYNAIISFVDSKGTCMNIRAVQRGELRSIDRKMLKPTAEALDDYLENAPQWNGGPIYRGISGTGHAHYLGLAVGDVIDMGGSSSWSSEPSVANSYAGDDGEIFVVDNPTKGTSTRHLSSFPEENEVTVSSRVTYRVTSIEYDDDGKKTTHLTQCRLPTSRESNGADMDYSKVNGFAELMMKKGRVESKSFNSILVEKYNHNHDPSNGKFSSGGSSSRGSTNSHKESQLEIIQRTNPAKDDYHTWIRSTKDIRTFEEALKECVSDGYYDEGDDFTPDYTWSMAEDAVRSGKITVYSSHNIEQGAWVTPSKMEAESYGGCNSKEVSIEDVAWVEPMQGMYAKVGVKKYNENHDPATGRFTTGSGGEAASGATFSLRQDIDPSKNAGRGKFTSLEDAHKGDPMDHDDADSGRVNPSFSNSTLNTVNCYMCVMAYEARRRGYDVEAAEELGITDYFRNNETKQWQNPDRSPVTKNYTFAPKEGETNPVERCYNEMEVVMRKGERFQFWFGWKVGGAHTISAWKDEGGITLYDPQINETYSGPDEVKKYMSRFNLDYNPQSRRRMPSLLRVDDKIFSMSAQTDAYLFRESRYERT